MNQCLIDVTVEFLTVAFHNILYYTHIYPKSVFEPRKKYNLAVHYSTHPDINKYIDLCLRAVAECLKSGQLSRVEFALTDSEYHPVLKFVFDFNKLQDYDETIDPYLVACEQNIRAFCLNLPCISHHFKKVPENGSFAIFLHTTESTAVSLAGNPELEEFPLVETKNTATTSQIISMRTVPILNYQLETYVEL